MNVSIPLTPFSKKIIVKEFGMQSPIVIAPGTPFYANLFMRSRGNAAITRALESELTESITFQLPENPVFNTHATRLRIGDYINTFHRRELNNYIRKRAVTGCPNVAAVDEFCKAHGIVLEIDITFDAVIRDYRRKKSEHFNEKKSDFLETKQRKKGRQNGNILKPSFPDFSLLNDSELDAVIDKYYNNHKGFFLRTRDRTELKLMKRKLIAFIYRSCARRSVEQTLRKLKLAPTQRVTVWKYNDSFKNYLSSLPPIEA